MFEISRTDLGSQDRNCSRHGGFVSHGRTLQIGRVSRDVWSPCAACDADKKTQADLLRQQAGATAGLAQIEKMLGQAAIPARFVGKSLDNYLAETAEQDRALRLCRRYVEHFDVVLSRGSTLMLLGQPGTGKTHLATAVLQALMPTHVGAYTTTMDLIRRLRGSWGGRGGSESDVLAELTALPLLVIDEIGVQFGSDGERIHLHDVLDRRYRDMRPTILISNLDDAGFQAYVGDRVYDRLTEVGAWMQFSGPSHRTKSRKESA